MLSDACKEKKITFVMGAGSSLPFIANGYTRLSSDYLTRQISDRDKWKAIYDEFRQNIPKNRFPEYNFNVTVEEILSVIERLKAINEREVSSKILEQVSMPLPKKIDDFYGIGKINFEHILYLLDKLCNYLCDRKNSIDNILFDVWEGAAQQREMLQSKKGWNYVPYLCREVLVKAILDLWESCQKEQAIEKNKQFLTSVLEKFKAVSIYSLNYDPLLYEATKEIKIDDKTFRTGFSDGENFNLKEFYDSNNLIAFLHGHIGFVQEGMFDNMRLYDDYPNAQKRRISGVAHNQVDYCKFGDKGIHYNVHITSGLEKFESFHDNPYSCYIQRFSKDVMESPYIVFIGGGLGDHHITLFASNAWRVINGSAKDIRNLCDRWRMPSDEQRKIVIVDDSREDYLEFLNRRSILQRLFGLFKEGIPLKWGMEEEDRILKNNGYADFETWFLYLKGTEQFFSEIWNINGLF
jgi:hypothetical protein